MSIEVEIPARINSNFSLEEQARQAFDMRNELSLLNKSVPFFDASKLQAWQTEIINSVKSMPDGLAKTSAENALKAGRIEGRIFKWPQ
ncbi:hypothetical protein [Pseudomonas fluorescens]|uniref:hypothetical protein n=1 Tax=Pseudomonas fluorescens TaxID=294 RepID=UPI00163B1C07|nr:hypothetical protein [Pseudomonas fluorescens]